MCVRDGRRMSISVTRVGGADDEEEEVSERGERKWWSAFEEVCVRVEATPDFSGCSVQS